MIIGRITIGIRWQAGIVIGLTVLWYLSFGIAMNNIKGDMSVSWFAVYVLLPVVALLFTVIMWWSYLHSDRTQGTWVAVATLVFFSPFILVAAVYLSQR